MICSNCHKTGKNNDAFCAYCGSKMIANTANNSFPNQPYNPYLAAPMRRYDISKLMIIFTVCASFIAVICFFLPIKALGSWSANGIYMVERGFPEACSLVAIIFSFLGFIFALLSLKKVGAMFATIICSIIGIVSMFASVADDMECIGFGFVLYILMTFAAIVMSIVAMVKREK